jgi:hypothetical protein
LSVSQDIVQPGSKESEFIIPDEISPTKLDKRNSTVIVKDDEVFVVDEIETL